MPPTLARSGPCCFQLGGWPTCNPSSRGGALGARALAALHDLCTHQELFAKGASCLAAMARPCFRIPGPCILPPPRRLPGAPYCSCTHYRRRCTIQGHWILRPQHPGSLCPARPRCRGFSCSGPHSEGAAAVPPGLWAPRTQPPRRRASFSVDVSLTWAIAACPYPPRPLKLHPGHHIQNLPEFIFRAPEARVLPLGRGYPPRVSSRLRDVSLPPGPALAPRLASRQGRVRTWPPASPRGRGLCGVSRAGGGRTTSGGSWWVGGVSGASVLMGICQKSLFRVSGSLKTCVIIECSCDLRSCHS